MKIKEEKNNKKQDYTVVIVMSFIMGSLSVITLLVFLILVCTKQPQPTETPTMKCLTKIPIISPAQLPRTTYNIFRYVRHSKSNQKFVGENEPKPTENDLETVYYGCKNSTSIESDSVNNGLPLSTYNLVNVEVHKNPFLEKLLNSPLASDASSQSNEKHDCSFRTENLKPYPKTKIQQPVTLKPALEKLKKLYTASSVSTGSDLPQIKRAKRAVLDKEGEIHAVDKSPTRTTTMQPYVELWDTEDKIIEVEKTPKKSRKKEFPKKEKSTKNFQNLFSLSSENLMEYSDTFDVEDEYDTAMQYELFKQFEGEKRRGDTSEDVPDIVKLGDQPCCSKTFK